MTVQKPDMSESASAIWDAVTPTLIADDRLRPGDEHLFAQYCLFMAMAQDAHRKIEDEGMVVGGADTGSKLQKNPAFNIARECSNAAAQIGQRFGMSPTSRKALGIKTKSKSLGSIRAGLKA